MDMSREQAHDNIPRIDNYMAWGIIHDTIDCIYDDFESRICDNCKYFTFENEIIGTCQKGIYDKQLCSSEDHLVSSFGCNKWKSK